jgi:hypothetical protein
MRRLCNYLVSLGANVVVAARRWDISRYMWGWDG